MSSINSAPGLVPTPLGSRDQHFIRRFSGGYTAELAAEVRRAGGGRAWFDSQLRTGRDPWEKKLRSWFPSLRRSPQEIARRDRAGIQGAWEVMDDLSRWTLLMRIGSPWQVQEQLVAFWSDLLHVPLMNDKAWYHRVDYDRMIRRHALGRFDLLLTEATTHAAQGLHLDNVYSTKREPNENLGRELLELHTVGVDGGYDERDVKQSSRMLTGYRVDDDTSVPYYDPSAHYVGRIKVMGFKHPNSSKDGRKATEAYLHYLAHHPATARRIATRLCVRFVRDDPPKDLVKSVAKAFRRSGTAIQPALEALVEHPAFAKSVRRKVRTPIDDYVAAVRGLDLRIGRPVSEESFANAMNWQCGEMGQLPYDWPPPDGFPADNLAWSSTGKVLTSFDVHRTLAGGWWPDKQVRYRGLQSWLPELPARLGAVIDHVGLRLLGEEPPQSVREAVAAMLGKGLTAKVEEIGDWEVVGILATLLDSPTHMKR